MQFHPTLQNSKESESNSYWAINFHHQLQKPNNHRDRFEKISESWVSHVHSGDVETDGKALLFFFKRSEKNPQKGNQCGRIKERLKYFCCWRERERECGRSAGPQLSSIEGNGIVSGPQGETRSAAVATSDAALGGKAPPFPRRIPDINFFRVINTCIT